MARSIDYYFSLVSPWAYIGHVTFMDVTQSRGLTVNFKPISLASVFPETGGLPLAKRAPARQRYRILELQRWREKRGEMIEYLRLIAHRCTALARVPICSFRSHENSLWL
jgi:2-hydroxychromene-2-carboxylate isomerase